MSLELTRTLEILAYNREEAVRNHSRLRSNELEILAVLKCRLTRALSSLDYNDVCYQACCRSFLPLS
jgi:hypothetical protein